ncbi:hypothetical protein BT69DRAFT_1319089 [Atractiella rhizophila]|nr:hypothetical protein BT69DRAFT_1319089 [Atractiella rhizophila]
MGGGKMDSDSENDYLKVDGRPSNECSQTTGFPSNQSSSSTPPSLARRGTKGRSISPSDSPLLSKTYEHINLGEGEGAGGPGEISGKVKRSESENVPKETCKLLYAKSAVFVHPTSYLKDNVEGWLAIVQRGDAKEGTTESILLSWIPSSLLSQSSDHKTYVSVDLSQSGTLSTSETIDSNSILVSLPPSSSPNSPAFSLPLSQVYSIQLRPPTLSSWFASCNIYSYPPSPSATSSQRELPTLYFHDDRPASTTTANTPGGTKDSRIPISSSGPSSSSPFAKPHSPISEFLAHLRPHCTSLLRSALDSSLYLVNPSRADVEVHSVPVFEDDAIDLPVPGTSAGAGTRAKPNFLRDQSGMKKQLTLLQSLIALMDPQLYRFLERVGALNLFFVFRWMLCLFKREFEWLQVQRIWEFHIFFALAIIESQRDVIMRYLTEFDEILKYCNELAMTMDPEPLLARAEVLFLTFRSIIETYDRRRGEEKDVGTSPMSTSQTLRRRAGSAPEPIVKSESGRRDSLKSKLPPFDEALRELLE